MMMMMMMTFITRRGEGQGTTKKEGKATKSEGRGLEEGASRALMRQFTTNHEHHDHIWKSFNRCCTEPLRANTSTACFASENGDL